MRRSRCSSTSQPRRRGADAAAAHRDAAHGDAVAHRIQPADRSGEPSAAGPRRRRPWRRCCRAPTCASASSATRRAASSRMAGDVLRPGVNRVSLLSGATLIDANEARQAAAAHRRRHTRTRRCCRGRDRSRSRSNGAHRCTFTPGRASFVLPVPRPAPRVRPSTCPAIKPTCTCRPASSRGESTLDGRTIVEATLDPGSPTEVWWSMRDSAPMAAAREMRALADVMTLVTLGDSDVRMVALIDVHGRAGRAADDRSAAACGLRAHGHFGQLARNERAGRRQRSS